MCQLICCPTISLTLLGTLWPQTKQRHRLPRHIWQSQSQNEHSHTKQFQNNTHKMLRYTFPARSTARLRITFFAFFCVVQGHSLRACHPKFSHTCRKSHTTSRMNADMMSDVQMNLRTLHNKSDRLADWLNSLHLHSSSDNNVTRRTQLNNVNVVCFRTPQLLQFCEIPCHHLEV